MSDLHPDLRQDRCITHEPPKLEPVAAKKQNRNWMEHRQKDIDDLLDFINTFLKKVIELVVLVLVDADCTQYIHPAAIMEPYAEYVHGNLRALVFAHTIY